MKLIRLFLPYHSSQVKPSQTVFHEKYIKFEFVYSTKKYVFCYLLYDFREKICEQNMYFCSGYDDLQRQIDLEETVNKCDHRTQKKHDKSCIFL